MKTEKNKTINKETYEQKMSCENCGHNFIEDFPVSIIGIGGILGLFLIMLVSILATAGPIVLVIWVMGKLFFN